MRRRRQSNVNRRNTRRRQQQSLSLRDSQLNHRISRSSTLTALYSIDEFDSNVFPSYNLLPSMDVPCPFCGALLFPNETTSGKVCCMNGKVTLPPMSYPPTELQMLLTGFTQTSTQFHRNIRAYNSMFAFTSLGVHLDNDLSNARDGCYTFRIHGELYHRIGPMLPNDSTTQPKFAQIYFSDPDFDVRLQQRMNIFSTLDRNTITIIQSCLERTNPYVSYFKSAHEIWTENQCTDLFLKVVEPAQDNALFDRRTYSTPTSSEVAVVISSSENTTSRDIVLTTRQGPLTKICELHPSYDCLAYPLFGANFGFQLNIRYSNHIVGNNNGRERCVTIREFYAYRLHKRESEMNMILFGRRLFHQWLVDQYAKFEQNNLRYINNNQRLLRAEVYQGLADVVLPEDDVDTSNIGRRIVLPSSFVGGPRYMRQLFQDSMAIVRHMGKPSLFITVTCNPDWIEIRNNLEEGQTAQDRPDIVSRVFNLKIKNILDDITKKGVLGLHLAHVYVIEFQKRGLPHAHLLLILANHHQIQTVQEIDRVVCAEIPDRDAQPGLYAAVTKHNLHGPCGLSFPRCPCMKDGKCSKNYPFTFNEETSVVDGSFPTYRRRNNNRRHQKRGFEFDNRWVVPYNPYLTLKYCCHINVEVCGSVQAVKYLYKYIYKGHDRAMVEVQNINECKEYLDCRYVAACEASWRLFGFPLHGKSHSVLRLDCHLEGQQYSTFRDGEPIPAILNRNSKTKLTSFFSLCQTSEHARNLLYHQVPTYYRWDQPSKEWI